MIDVMIKVIGERRLPKGNRMLLRGNPSRRRVGFWWTFLLGMILRVEAQVIP